MHGAVAEQEVHSLSHVHAVKRIGIVDREIGAGKVRGVAVSEHQGFARLRVRDHGIGVAPEALGRIFDRFERAVSSSEYGGLGLGLFLTREIVEAHGGSIQAASRPGEGTTFTLELPASALAVHAGQRPTAP